MKVAVIHEWFETFAGSEKVVEQILESYPEADVYALVDFLQDADRVGLKGKPVQTSFIQKLPFARRLFRNYLPLMPTAIEQFDLADYDTLISSNHAFAKGVIKRPDQMHVCYIHNPIRYAWEMQHVYLRQSNLPGVKGALVRAILHYLRMWDRLSRWCPWQKPFLMAPVLPRLAMAVLQTLTVRSRSLVRIVHLAGGRSRKRNWCGLG